MPTYPYFHRGANGGPGTAEEECLLGQKAAGRKVLGEQIWDRKLGAGLGSALLSNMELVVASELTPYGSLMLPGSTSHMTIPGHLDLAVASG